MTVAEFDDLSGALGRAIRAARLEAGESMRGLAARSGVSQPFLSEVERGQSIPSIATLYRIAAALDISPAVLLPSEDVHEVTVVRAGQGKLVPSSDRPGSAIGRVILSDPSRGLEIYEYVIDPDDDLDVWYEHPGHKVLHVLEGRLQLRFERRRGVRLGPGDWIVHPGAISHRWIVEGAAPVRLELVVIRPV